MPLGYVICAKNYNLLADFLKGFMPKFIAIFLALILLVLIAKRPFIVDFINNIFWMIAIAIVFTGLATTLKHSFYSLLAKNRNAKLKILQDGSDKLCTEIAAYSKLNLTSEYIPQRFSSKEIAQAFGKRWSRGGVDSFRAKSVDNNDCDEDHPRFDETSISSGILYTYPALFFGMNEAHKEDDEWFLDFNEAKNQWLKSYLEHLKQS